MWILNRELTHSIWCARVVQRLNLMWIVELFTRVLSFLFLLSRRGGLFAHFAGYIVGERCTAFSRIGGDTNIPSGAVDFRRSGKSQIFLRETVSVRFDWPMINVYIRQPRCDVITCLLRYFRFSQSTEFSRVYVNETISAVSQKIVLTKPIALLVHGWTDKFDSIFLRVNGKGKIHFILSHARRWL